MTQVLPTTSRIALVILALLTTVGCIFDGSALEERLCGSNRDCRPGFRCIDGVCQLSDDTNNTTNNNPNNSTVCPMPCSEGSVQVDTPGMDCPFVCCLDDDGDGVPRAQGCEGSVPAFDCQDDPARRGDAITPGKPEVCDGLDNDCNDQIDDALTDIPPCQSPTEAATLTGVCAGAVKTCTNGRYPDCTADDFRAHNAAYLVKESYCNTGLDPETGFCTTNAQGVAQLAPGVMPETAEAALCDGLDNDCDGTADEPETAIPCYPGADPDETGSNHCQAGTRTCDSAARTYSECTGAVTPVAETDDTRCDDIDQDCDLRVRPQGVACDCTSDQECYEGPNGTEDVGLCVGGLYRCVERTLGDECTNQVLPVVETCDDIGVDNDCDGEDMEMGDYNDAENRDVVNVIAEQPCTVIGRNGLCEQGRFRCVDGAIQCVQVNFPTTETCDDIDVDNDCDGTATDVHADAASRGNNAAVFTGGNEDVPKSFIEVVSGVGRICDTGLEGVCMEGRWSCAGGRTEATCRQITQAGSSMADANCDGMDDDCNGEADDGCRVVFGDLCCRPQASGGDYACREQMGGDECYGD